MKFVADSNIPALNDTFGRHGSLIRLDGRSICNADLRDEEVLLVRSVTRVNKDLLEGTKIRFVGSATIGIDHLDTCWMEANNIQWANAPGCNADAAAQYTLAMMWLACDRLGRDFHQQTVGIIGRGNVGRRLEHLLNALAIPVVCCDPPLQDAGEKNLVSLKQACSNSIVSLHTPLTKDGNYPTNNLFNAELLSKIASNTLVVNASRGGVIEKSALIEELQSGRLQAALDVWPDEPFIDQKMLKLVTVATPHVAGYSREGKLAGTSMIYDAFCKAFSITKTDKLAATKSPGLEFPESVSNDDVIKRSIWSSSQVPCDDTAIRNLSTCDERVQIDSLRSNYPDRFEFNSYIVNNVSADSVNLLRRMGFNIGQS